MQVKVYANSDDTFVVWKTDQAITDCRGFAIQKRRSGSSQIEVVPNYVGWGEKGVAGPKPSTEWPFQRYTWCDYKARSGEKLSYRIVPVIGSDPDHLRPAEDQASEWTTEITLHPDGTTGVAAYFKPGEKQRHLRDIIEDPEDRTRKFLGGELRNAMLKLLADAKKRGVEVHAALYELDDPELTEALGQLGDKANVILANGSTKKKKVAKVKVHLDDVAPEAATRLLELGGASAASRQRNLDRHWRNIRTITLHNPVAYKALVIGQNLLHGTPVPANAYF